MSSFGRYSNLLLIICIITIITTISIVIKIAIARIEKITSEKYFSYSIQTIIPLESIRHCSKLYRCWLL